MIVLHGSWIPAQRKREARLVLWAEDWEAPPRRRSGAVKPLDRLRSRPHPNTAKADRLRQLFAAAGMPAAATAESVPLTVRLPSAGGLPLPSPGLADAPHPDEPPVLAPWRVDALTLAIDGAVDGLPSLPEHEPPDGALIGDDLRFWVQAGRVALEMLYRERVVPTVQQQGRKYAARWRPVLDDWVDIERFGALTRSMPPACRATLLRAADPPPRPAELLTSFLSEFMDQVARTAMAAVPLRPLHSPYYIPVGDQWVRALAGEPQFEGWHYYVEELHAQFGTAEPEQSETGPEFDRSRIAFRLEPPAFDEPPDAAAASSSTASTGSPGRASALAQSFGGVAATAEPGLLLPPAEITGSNGDQEREAGSGADSSQEAAEPPQRSPWRLRFLLQSLDDPSVLLPAETIYQHTGESTLLLDRRFHRPQETLLGGLWRAAAVYPALHAVLREPRPVYCPLTTTEAYEFLRGPALQLRAAGYGVYVPGFEHSLGLRLRLGKQWSAGQQASSGLLGVDALVDFNWQLALGGETLTREEFESLVELKEPLVQVRGQWVELRPDLVEKALAFLKKQGDRGAIGMAEALRLALAPDLEDGLQIEGVETSGSFHELIERLSDGGPREDVSEPPGFVGELRHYQKTGVAWMATLRRYGLGACLADDMGLGKTVEMIALLLHEKARERKDGPALLICPTSVVNNWRHELHRFAPSLSVMVHHGAGRNKETFAEEAVQHDIVLSTYALIHRDEASLLKVRWSDVILDETQNIKNPSTKAAQTARRLRAGWRAAMTGTPVENRLSDLWSIFNFLNPGYLGSNDEFRRRFANRIERGRDPDATERLRSLVAPFVLRRVKTDRSIISDLPEKNEMKVFCSLTKEQATLYQAVVKDSLRRIEAADGFARRGEILAALTRLKQVCNHPAQFLKDGSRLAGRSGKLTRLTEMLEEVRDVGDRALIFTQFAEMGRLLQQHLEAELKGDVPFLYGDTSVQERDRMVTEFQQEEGGPTAFVLSIKAGGTGLNLTRANHVFHFDRWWNPAVENQATDRAFRIGQRRDVQVHKFVCGGTLEERIDQLIERKVELTEAIMGTGETWITEMSTEQLRELFVLREDEWED